MKRRDILTGGLGLAACLSLLAAGQPAIATDREEAPPASADAQFYAALRARTTAVLGGVLNAPVYSIESPAQGDFRWNWSNDDAFNDLTYQYVSAQVKAGSSPDSLALSNGGSFPNNYDSALKNLDFSLGTADRITINTANHRGAAQERTIVADFQGKYGTITDDKMKAAKTALGLDDTDVLSKIDYVVEYMMATKWCAKGQSLTRTEMEKARSLKALLPRAPMGADNLIRTTSVWLGLVHAANALVDEESNGNAELSAIMANTESPDVAKGGMQTFDPNTGDKSQVVDGYGIGRTASEIENDFQGGNSISMSAETSSSADHQYSVKIDGQAGFTAGSLLTLSAKAGGSYEMSNVDGASADSKVEITFPHYSVVPIAAAPWQQSTGRGWFTPEPFRQALANWDAAAGQAKDVTGYKFEHQPGFNFARIDQGGDFSQLTNVVISSSPTIKVTFTKADYKRFQQSWKQNASMNVKLFGLIDLGGIDEGAYKSTVTQGADNSTFSVTFSASPEVLAVPEFMQSAYVIGGTVSAPIAK